MWAAQSFIALTQNPPSGKWYGRFTMTDGQETRCERLKFAARPTMQEARDAVQAAIAARNAAETLAAKQDNPPSQAAKLSADRRQTVSESLAFIRDLADLVDDDVRDEFQQFVTSLRENLTKWGLAGGDE